MDVILGIDPGSRITGYGLIQQEGSRLVYIASGCIKPQAEPLPERLQQIYAGLDEIIARYRPTDSAIEAIFMHKNASSALKLGQARGVAILALAKASINVSEYSPRQVKQAIVGIGSAEKEQVQHMVRIVLNLNQTPQADASDALAIAICHAHMGCGGHPSLSVKQYRRGRIIEENKP